MFRDTKRYSPDSNENPLHKKKSFFTTRAERLKEAPAIVK